MERAPRSIIAPVTLVGVAQLAPTVRAAAEAEQITKLAPDDQQRLLDLLVRERLDELEAGLPARGPSPNRPDLGTAGRHARRAAAALVQVANRALSLRVR
jgi:hypothetical protein